MSSSPDNPKNESPTQPVVVVPAPKSDSKPPASPYNQPVTKGWRSETIPGPAGRKD
jgi:hypothetical protein